MSCTIDSERCGGMCTGYDGSKIWKARQDINKKIDCKTCREEAEKLETFTHDIVNVRLGKQVHDKKNWDKFVSIVECSNNSCKEAGKC